MNNYSFSFNKAERKSQVKSKREEVPEEKAAAQSLVLVNEAVAESSMALIGLRKLDLTFTLSRTVFPL